MSSNSAFWIKTLIMLQLSRKNKLKNFKMSILIKTKEVWIKFFKIKKLENVQNSHFLRSSINRNVLKHFSFQKTNSEVILLTGCIRFDFIDSNYTLCLKLQNIDIFIICTFYYFFSDPTTSEKDSRQIFICMDVYLVLHLALRQPILKHYR